MAAAPNFLQQFASAAMLKDGYGKKKVLVTIFQRGAVDGLNMVVPHGDAEYYNLRRTIAIQKPGAADGAINLDGFFGLHPALKPLEKFWQSKQLAVVHSAGSPDNTRSHFDAQDYMESATPGVKATRDGWLNRVLQAKAEKDASPFRAVSLTGQLPRSLYGRAPSVAMTDLSDFAIKAGDYTKSVQGGFEGIWQENAKDSLSDTGAETFQAVNFLKQANPAQYRDEKRRGLSEFAARSFLKTNRPIDQSGRRARSRFRRIERLGHAQQSRRRARAAREFIARFRKFYRRFRDRFGQANGRRGFVNNVGIRQNRPRKRHARHRPRTRQRDARFRKFRQRRQSFRRLERFKRRSAQRRTRFSSDDDFRDVFGEVAYQTSGKQGFE
jgi:hypothetical protein